MICASAFYLFLVHTFTAKNSFVNPRLFLDRNFSVSMFFIFVIGVTYLASLALMTPYLQTLMGYPVVTAGIVMGPRGVGTMVCMFIVGTADRQGRYPRLLLFLGFSLTAWAMYDMTGWTPDVSQWTIVSVGFIQGAGLGFLFVPLTTIAFATLPAPYARRRHRPLQSLAQYRLERRHRRCHRADHRERAEQPCVDRGLCHAVQPRIQRPGVMQNLDPLKAAGRAALDGMITTQATIIAYMDDFKLLMIMSLVSSRWSCCCASLLKRRPRGSQRP